MIDTKLADLRAQFEQGRHQMEMLDRRRDELRDTMLRLGGAIQALEELAEEEQPATA